MNFKLSIDQLKRAGFSLLAAFVFTMAFFTLFIFPTLNKYQSPSLDWEGLAMCVTLLILGFVIFMTCWEDRKRIALSLSGIVMVFALIGIFRGDLLTGDVGLENLKQKSPRTNFLSGGGQFAGDGGSTGSYAKP